MSNDLYCFQNWSSLLINITKQTCETLQGSQDYHNIQRKKKKCQTFVSSSVTHWKKSNKFVFISTFIQRFSVHDGHKFIVYIQKFLFVYNTTQ